MRLWSLHPKYLDSSGLGGLWKESLQAQKILVTDNKSLGYYNHSHLIRFRQSGNPRYFIEQYLLNIRKEAINRNYKYNSYLIKEYIGSEPSQKFIKVTSGQLKHEYNLLIERLQARCPGKMWDNINNTLNGNKIEPHPIFKIVEGEIEDWEKMK